jgi:DNA-binding MarR family transcriptional regulator
MKPAMKLNPSNPTVLEGINGIRKIINNYDISFNQAALLSALPPFETPIEKRITPSEVAEVMGITRGGVTRLCRALIDRKLIAHDRSPDDWRYVLLQRTKKGDALMARMLHEANGTQELAVA